MYDKTTLPLPEPRAVVRWALAATDAPADAMRRACVWAHFTSVSVNHYTSQRRSWDDLTHALWGSTVTFDELDTAGAS